MAGAEAAAETHLGLSCWSVHEQPVAADIWFLAVSGFEPLHHLDLLAHCNRVQRVLHTCSSGEELQ